MPPFRGTLTLEEARALARYLRTFVPGTEQPRPDRLPADSQRETAKAPEQLLLPPGKYMRKRSILRLKPRNARVLTFVRTLAFLDFDWSAQAHRMSVRDAHSLQSAH